MLHIGLMDFFVFVLYYVILKVLVHVVNVETRRNGLKTPAGVSGLLA